MRWYSIPRVIISEWHTTIISPGHTTAMLPLHTTVILPVTTTMISQLWRSKGSSGKELSNPGRLFVGCFYTVIDFPTKTHPNKAFIKKEYIKEKQYWTYQLNVCLPLPLLYYVLYGVKSLIQINLILCWTTLKTPAQPQLSLT